MEIILSIFIYTWLAVLLVAMFKIAIQVFFFLFVSPFIITRHLFQKGNRWKLLIVFFFALCISWFVYLDKMYG